ncbi:hypothetical protein ONA91_34510, partial [Micromonospora sp. DR5-3]|uniref:hypothetical protein n=1 Tax=unclassified Micromonospora TaxID=2617518 RepID=UPI001CA30CA3
RALPWPPRRQPNDEGARQTVASATVWRATAFIASERTEHDVPHAVACRALGMSESWFYKLA